MKAYISGDLIFPEKLDETFLVVIDNTVIESCDETIGFFTSNYKPITKEISGEDMVVLDRKVLDYITKNGEPSGTILSSKAKKLTLIEPIKPIILNNEKFPPKRALYDSNQIFIPKTTIPLGSSEGEGGGGEWVKHKTSHKPSKPPEPKDNLNNLNKTNLNKSNLKELKEESKDQEDNINIRDQEEEPDTNKDLKLDLEEKIKNEKDSFFFDSENEYRKKKKIKFLDKKRSRKIKKIEEEGFLDDDVA